MAEPLVLGCHIGFLIGTLSIRQSLKRSDAHKCLRSDLGDKHFVRLMISKGMTLICGCLEFISARSERVFVGMEVVRSLNVYVNYSGEICLLTL